MAHAGRGLLALGPHTEGLGFNVINNYTTAGAVPQAVSASEKDDRTSGPDLGSGFLLPEIPPAGVSPFASVGGPWSLGTIAKSASRLGTPGAWGMESNRVRRFVYQAGSRELIPGERVAYCLRRPHGQSVGVLYVPATGSACYRGLMTCGSVWHCPVCAAKISERRRVELGAGLSSWRSLGGRVLLVTYTIRHKRFDDLGVSLDGLLAARRAAKSGRWAKDFNARYGVAGVVRALEVTHGANGWHPHIHELVFVPAGVDLAGFVCELRARWSVVLRRVGLRDVNQHGLEVSDCDADVADYVSKWGRDRVWGPEHELAKQVVKSARSGSRSPAQLLAAYVDDVDRVAGDLWREYAGVFKGRRQLAWSKGLRALLGLGVEVSDEVLADEHEEDAVLLASLTLEQWRYILANDARGEVLDVASKGDRVVLWDFLVALGVPVSGGVERWAYMLGG